MKRSISHTCLAAAALLIASQANAAESNVTPSLAVNQEYTDNVYESATNKRTDYITRLMPGIAANYKAARWDGQLGYNLDYRTYARASRGDETTHNINARSQFRIIEEKLFLDLNDTYKRTTLDITRDTTGESLTSNQSDQNIGTVSPYLVLRPTPMLNLKTGYRYINTWYKEPQAVNKQDHIGFINAAYDLSAKLFMNTDYTYTREIPEQGSSFHRHEVLAGPRYEYADKSFIFAQGGVIASNYDSRGNTMDTSWKAGLTHTMDNLVAAANAGTSYSDDPLGNSTLTTTYAVTLTQTIKQGTIALNGSYKVYEDGNSGQTKNKSWSGGFTSALEITPSIKANLGFTYENYHDLMLAGRTDRYFLDSGISWLLGKYLNLGLSYKFIDYESAQIASDNKQVNRVIFEAKFSY